MGAAPPPTPDRDGWTGDFGSSNGANAGDRLPSPMRVVVLGYITAAAMPPVGLLIGLGLLVRRSKPGSRHGVWIVAVSVVAALVWLAIIKAGLLTATNNDVNY